MNEAPIRRVQTIALLLLGLLMAGCSSAQPSVEDADGVVEPPIVDPELLQDPQIETFFDTHVADVREDPESAGAWQALGEAYHAQMLFPEAETCYTQAIRLSEPEPDPRVVYLRGIVRYNLGKRGEAIDDMERVVEIDPYLPARWRLGYFHLEQNDPETALGYFSQVTDVDPGDPSALIGVSRALLLMDRPEDAVRILEPLRSVDPINDTYIRSLLADAYRRIGDLEKAKSVAIASDSANATLRDEWLELLEFKFKGHARQMESAQRLIELQHYNLALEVLKREQTRYPEDATVVGTMGFAYMLGGDFDKAIEHSEQAIELDPDYYEGYYQLAVSYYNQGFGSDDPEAATALLETAREHNEKALQLAPDFAPALNVNAQILADLGETEEAIAYYKRAFESVEPGERPQTTGYLHAAARLEGAIGRWEESIKTLEQAREVNAEDALSHVLLAIAHLEVNDREAARAAYERALELVPEDTPDEALRQDLTRLRERLESS